MRPIARLAAVVAATLFATAAPASAQVFWSGTGLTGTDPFGQVWRFDNSFADPADPTAGQLLTWGVPGLGFIPPIWPATAPVLTSFQIRFNGGASIVPSISYDLADVFTTRLLSGRGAGLDPLLFTVSLSGDRTTATFIAPPGGEVDPGDRWFVRVIFAGQDVPTSFDAVYNGALAATAVPEPATIALVATGLAGVMALARRRRRA